MKKKIQLAGVIALLETVIYCFITGTVASLILGTVAFAVWIFCLGFQFKCLQSTEIENDNWDFLMFAITVLCTTVLAKYIDQIASWNTPFGWFWGVVIGVISGVVIVTVQRLLLPNDSKVSNSKYKYRNTAHG